MGSSGVQSWGHSLPDMKRDGQWVRVHLSLDSTSSCVIIFFKAQGDVWKCCITMLYT